MKSYAMHNPQQDKQMITVGWYGIKIIMEVQR